MENLIVLTIVGAAGVWGGLRLFRKSKPSGCGSGCGGCHCASKPQGLVQLRK